jgi:hypothetical protein
MAPMAAQMIDRMGIWWQFVASLACMMQTLAHCGVIAMSACQIPFVDILMFPFDVFWRMCGENSCNVFILLFIVLWVIHIFATLCRRVVVLMLWHAFLLLGLLRSGVFPSLLLIARWLSFFLFMCIFRLIVRTTGIYVLSEASPRVPLSREAVAGNKLSCPLSDN